MTEMNSAQSATTQRKREIDLLASIGNLRGYRVNEQRPFLAHVDSVYVDAREVLAGAERLREAITDAMDAIERHGYEISAERVRPVLALLSRALDQIQPDTEDRDGDR